MTAKTVSSRRGGSLVGIFTLAAAALIAILALLLVFAMWRTIEPGYVGIVFDKASRKVTNTLDPGWVFIHLRKLCGTKATHAASSCGSGAAVRRRSNQVRTSVS